MRYGVLTGNDVNRFLLAGAIAMAALSAPASATSDITIRFTGDCTDCAGQATATLVLKDFSLDGVNPGLSTANLVNFTYDGTNLIDPYSSGAISSLSGSLTNPAFPGPAVAGLSGSIFVNVIFPNGINGRAFVASSNGGWSVTPTSGGAPEDYGTNAIFTLVSGSVPEIASWAMFITGFGLIGSTMRRRRIPALVAVR